jgi:hypothetical protein
MSRLALIAAVSLATACNMSRIRNQADEALDDNYVVAVYPSDGAMAVETNVSIVVVVGQPAVDTVPWVIVTAGGEQWAPDCSLDGDGLYVRCRPIKGLPRDTPLDVAVYVGDTRPTQLNFSSEFPDESPAWQLNTGARFEHFGDSSDLTTETLGGMMEDSDMVGAIVDWERGKSMDTWFLIGKADVNDHGNATLEGGLTMALPITIGADGRFKSERTETFMPIGVNGTTVQALVLDAVVTGTAGENGIQDFTLSGVLTASALVDLVEPLGSAGSLVLEAIVIDTDTDGDGSVDGASFTLNANPEAVTLQDQ